MRDNNKHSRFWLGDRFDTIDQTDVVALSQWKRSIGNFVTIVTNRSDIKVRYNTGNESYTDGKTVTISAQMDHDHFDSTVGLALHEGSHCLLTDFTTLRDLNNAKYPAAIDSALIADINKKNGSGFDADSYIKDKVKTLVNIIEDRRIDNYIYTSSPGYRSYYHAMYNRYFNSEMVDKALQSAHYRTETWGSYRFRLINMTNKHTDLDALALFKEVYNQIDIHNISRLTNTTDVYELAGEIFAKIEKTMPSVEEQKEQEEQDGQQGGTDGNGKTRKIVIGGNGGGDVGDFDQLTPEELDAIKEAIEKQNDFTDNNVAKKELDSDTAQKVEVVSSAGVEQKDAGGSTKGNPQSNSANQNKQSSHGGGDVGYNLGTTPVLVVNTLSKSLVKSGAIDMLTRGWADNSNIDKGLMLGRILGKKLKVRSEERPLDLVRMKRGKVHGRMLHEIGSGNMNVFKQTMVERRDPAIIFISIDASGSMSGSSWNNCQVSASAIAQAAAMTNNMDVIITYRGTQRSGSTQSPSILIGYDSRVDNISKVKTLLKHVNTNSTTPEGLCFEATMEMVLKASRGKDAYFINFSDGYPYYSDANINYSGHNALNHTRSQIQKMRMAGIKILSFFISDSSNSPVSSDFKRMYGADAKSIDVTSIVPLARELNKMFE